MSQEVCGFSSVFWEMLCCFILRQFLSCIARITSLHKKTAALMVVKLFLLPRVQFCRYALLISYLFGKTGLLNTSTGPHGFRRLIIDKWFCLRWTEVDVLEAAEADKSQWLQILTVSTFAMANQYKQLDLALSSGIIFYQLPHSNWQDRSLDFSSHLLTSPVSSYPPSSSHSPSLSLFHPLFFPLWVCSLQTTRANTIIVIVIAIRVLCGTITMWRCHLGLWDFFHDILMFYGSNQ